MNGSNGAGPGLTRVGLGYRAVFPEAALTVTRLRESRGELSGELSVHRLYPAGPAGGLALYLGRFNVSSMSTRKGMAAYLHERDATIAGGWLRLVEAFCHRVLSEHRQSEPVVRIGRQPRR